MKVGTLVTLSESADVGIVLSVDMHARGWSAVVSFSPARVMTEWSFTELTVIDRVRHGA